MLNTSRIAMLFLCFALIFHQITAGLLAHVPVKTHAAFIELCTLTGIIQVHIDSAEPSSDETTLHGFCDECTRIGYAMLPESVDSFHHQHADRLIANALIQRLFSDTLAYIPEARAPPSVKYIS